MMKLKCKHIIKEWIWKVSINLITGLYVLIVG